MRAGILVFALVLAAAIGLQVVGGLNRRPEPRPPALSTALPTAVGNWAVADQPIAETAEMRKAVGELLNFDDAVFRTYRNGARQFDVYVACWEPGKMSERLVAGHSPDVCWVAAGWTPVARGEAAGGDPTTTWASAGGQYRVFNDPHGAPRWVVFWHTSGGQLVDYGAGNGVPPWWTIFSDLAHGGLNQRKSQYFVRVSANVPWRELANDAGFRAVMAGVNKLLD
jgi:hypothetical protein